MKRATIADVAQRAGVTKSTVSHALSGKRPVSPETRRRIEEAIRELEYRPHPLAQRLAGGQSHTVGFVYPIFGSQITGLEMKFIASAATVVNQSDYAFLLLTHPEQRPDNLRRFVQGALMDGVILMQVRLHDPRIELLQSAGLPFVLVGRAAENAGLAYVDADIDAALSQIVDHLVGLGHRAIGYLHHNNPEFGFAARGVAAYQAACQRHDLPPIMRACGMSPDSGQRATETLLGLYPELTAIIGWTDTAAWGAVQGAQSHGRRVPEELSIVGFNPTVVRGVVPLNLTYLDIQPEEMAARAASMLLAIMENRSPSETQVLVPPRLILGDTTVPPRRYVPPRTWPRPD